MLGSSRTRRAVTAALVTAAVASIGAAAAEAKTVTVTDDTAADFAQGTQSDTVVRTDGAVEIAPALEEAFGGTSLPAGWSSTLWDPTGTATVTDGSLRINGSQVVNAVAAGPGSSLEFTATFGDVANQHVGFATDFNNPPWAIFSTGGGTGLSARTSDGDGPLEDIASPVSVSSGQHTYRIDWTPTAFVYFVDGAQVASHAIPMSSAMFAAASDFNVDQQEVAIDSLALRTRTTGTYTSRALDAGDERVSGLSFTAAGAGAIAYETRTADTPGGLTGDWQPVAGGVVASAPKRYLQYRATLTTPNPGATPRLDKVDVGFTVDDQAPTVTIQDVAVSGRAAKVTFGSDDADAVVECSLDGAAFVACASPREFSGLAVGTHKIEVRATDAFDNVGSATRSFEIAAPPASPGTTPSGGSGSTPPPAPPTGTTPDRTAPKVLVMGRSARVTKRGVAKFRIRCPRSEQSCAIAVQLKLAGKRVASKSLTVASGGTGTFRLRLSAAARRKLAASSSLAATAVVRAEDAAGNLRKTKHRVTLSAS
jgi:hypothetical protein